MIHRSVVLAVLLVLSEPAQAKCSPDSQPMTVVGQLVSRTFPGPPNYANISDGDRPDTFWLLRLPKATCVAFAAQENGVRLSRTRIIQLVLRPEQYVTYKGLMGKEVRITGRPFAQISGYHHAAILLDDVSIHAIPLTKP